MLAAAPAEHLWQAQFAALCARLVELVLSAAGPPPQHDADLSEWLDWSATQAAVTTAAAVAKTRLLLAWWTQEALHGRWFPTSAMFTTAMPGELTVAMVLSSACRDLAGQLAAAGWEPGQVQASVRRRAVLAAQGHSDTLMRSDCSRLLQAQAWADGWKRRARPGSCAICRALAARPFQPTARPWHAAHVGCGCVVVLVAAAPRGAAATVRDREAASRLLIAVRADARAAAAAMTALG